MSDPDARAEPPAARVPQRLLHHLGRLSLQHEHAPQIVLEPRARTGDELHDALCERELLRGEHVDLCVRRGEAHGELRVFLAWGRERGGRGEGERGGGLEGAQGVADVFGGFFLDLLVQVCRVCVSGRTVVAISDLGRGSKYEVFGGTGDRST